VAEHTYCLRTWAIGSKPELPIDQARYLALRMATRAQRLFLNFEEKLDLLLANYSELEQELLSLALRNSIQRNLDWSQGSADRLLVNRRLANLLSTTRLYVDHASHELNVAASAQPLLGNVSPRAYFGREYDVSLGYRVMEALRNHVQHRSIPVASLTYESRVDEHSGGSLFLFSVSLNLDLEALRQDSDFKKEVLDQLERLPETEVDLVLFVRQHVEGIARAHLAIREAIAPAVAEADKIVDAAIADWQASGQSLLSLAAVQQAERGLAVEH